MIVSRLVVYPEPGLIKPLSIASLKEMNFRAPLSNNSNDDNNGEKQLDK